MNSFAQSDSVTSKEKTPKVVVVDSSYKGVFTKVDIEATIDPSAWRGHLQEAMQPHMERALKKKIPDGTYTVIVKFLIERDGSISDVSAMNNPGYGLAEGAVEVVRSAPNWTPGVQNGVKVRSYRTQPITFVFSSK